MRYFDRLQPLALLVLRLVLGVIMVGHGYPKIFGGLSHHVQFVGSLGLPGSLAYLSAAAEFFGGILLIAGLFTSCAALAILIDLSVAIVKVHWKNGLLGNSDISFPLLLPPLPSLSCSSGQAQSRWRVFVAAPAEGLKGPKLSTVRAELSPVMLGLAICPAHKPM